MVFLPGGGQRGPRRPIVEYGVLFGGGVLGVCWRAGKGGLV